MDPRCGEMATCLMSSNWNGLSLEEERSQIKKNLAAYLGLNGKLGSRAELCLLHCFRACWPQILTRCIGWHCYKNMQPLVNLPSSADFKCFERKNQLLLIHDRDCCKFSCDSPQTIAVSKNPREKWCLADRWQQLNAVTISLDEFMLHCPGSVWIQSAQEPPVHDSCDWTWQTAQEPRAHDSCDWTLQIAQEPFGSSSWFSWPNFTASSTASSSWYLWLKLSPFDKNRLRYHSTLMTLNAMPTQSKLFFLAENRWSKHETHQHF